MLNRQSFIFKLLLLLIVFTGVFGSSSRLNAQCIAGYTAAQVNWDNLDYYWNSGGAGPYQNYITNAMEQSQHFAIGKTNLTIATNNAGLVNPGGGISAENATHTGDVAANYSGEDVQYNPSANNQTITITFANPVSVPNFTLYDIDRSAVFTISATNNLSAPTTVNVATYASTILTIGGSPTARTITANSTSLANNVNRGTATITVPGLVNSITITVNTRGSDPVFWLSDINACVSGTFPTNYHQGANNRPFVGPTQNMPDYFLVTPDNNSCYYLDPATGVARELFTDAARDFVNSFAYDPYNRFLYYISENIAIDPNNRELKRYSLDTETSSVIIADMRTTLGIPTFEYGIESAGSAFYDGALYFGVEGGKYNVSGTSNDRTRETIIWRIDFDGSNNPVSAYQVFATDHYLNASNTAVHDWGDFIMKNGVIYNYNTARNGGDYSQSKYHHYDLMTGQMLAVYNNPGTTIWNGQSGMTWAEGLYYFRGSTTPGNSEVGSYNEAGVNGAATTITVASGPVWPGNAGDASDPFRPKCDFGDAPASYDPYSNPAIQSPAVHERTEDIRLGATWDYEFYKRGVTGSNDVDDGVTFQTVLPPGPGNSYYAFVDAYNNSGSNATLIAWLDYNGNGIFDASEAITPVTVPSSASPQSIGLWWPSAPNTFTNGQTTYMRIRITSASAGMTTSHATGYFNNGEVEDYIVLIDNYPLATQLLNFNANVENKKVHLDWKVEQNAGTFAYEIERSSDGLLWNKIYDTKTSGKEGSDSYSTIDNNPLKGISFYRLRIKENTGNDRLSPVKRIVINDFESAITISPNPAKDQLKIQFESAIAENIELVILSIEGNTVFRRKEKVYAGINNLSIQLPAFLNTGTYIARMTIGNTVINKKIIITR